MGYWLFRYNRKTILRKKMKKTILFTLFALMIVGCQQQKVKAPAPVAKPEVKEKVDIDALFKTEKEDDEDELYFKDSKGKKFTNNYSDSKLTWIDVIVPHTNKKNYTTFSVMSRVVSKKDFLGRGSNTEPITNISYEAANNFCSIKFNGAVLSTPYIFEYARRNILVLKPNNQEFIEMISPVDYEDFDDTFFTEGDNLESSEEDSSTMIIFDWNLQKYYAISLSYKSKNMGFRCYK